MIYLLVGEELLKTYILGGFSKKEDAEEQLNRLEEKIKECFMISFVKFKIIDVPFNSIENVDETLKSIG